MNELKVRNFGYNYILRLFYTWNYAFYFRNLKVIIII